MLQLTGNTGRAEEVLRELREGDESRIPLGFFVFHLSGGQPDQAADWLEKAIEQHFAGAGFWRPFAQALYPSPRWAELAKKMNLPQ